MALLQTDIQPGEQSGPLSPINTLKAKYPADILKFFTPNGAVSNLTLYDENRMSELSGDTYSTSYNPWGNDPAARDTKASFEQQFAQNLQPALADYTQLKARYYALDQVRLQTEASQSINATALKNVNSLGVPLAPGTKVEDGLLYKGEVRRLTESLYGMGVSQEFITAQTNADQTDNWSTNPLNDAEKYMLYRYERAALVTDQNIGTGTLMYGEDQYNYITDSGGRAVSKDQQQVSGQTASVQLGKTDITRKERSAGKNRFSSPGVQL